MTVWIVRGRVDYEADELIGVFTSYDATLAVVRSWIGDLAEAPRDAWDVAQDIHRWRRPDGASWNDSGWDGIDIRPAPVDVDLMRKK